MKGAGAPLDPEWWRCADEIVGQRCALPGAMAHGTIGGGPWYCARHFFGLQAPGPAHAPTTEVRERIRETLTPAPRDPEADAERAAIQDPRAQ